MASIFPVRLYVILSEGMGILQSLADFLSIDDAPVSCALVFVLAGRPERKPYGWELFLSGLAPRLILSVGRYEVRQTAGPFDIPELLSLRDKTSPSQRHFWVDCQGSNRSASLAGLRKTNTYWELYALAEYLEPDFPGRIAIVSTSVHLRRVRFCCRRIAAFNKSRVLFLPVPEDRSCIQRDGWWRRADQCSYLLAEYVKLAAYCLLYGWR
jgi:DUF218 domain-containing protein